MKTVVIAFITLVLVIALVVVNSLLVSSGIDSVLKKLKSVPDSYESGEQYEEIYNEYMRRQNFFGLTVSHVDLTNIEDCFQEIRGAVKAKDDTSLIIAKSRLIGALTHLKRLSEINPDSIL